MDDANRSSSTGAHLNEAMSRFAPATPTELSGAINRPSSTNNNSMDADDMTAATLLNMNGSASGALVAGTNMTRADMARLSQLYVFYYSCWAGITIVGVVFNSGGVLIAACKPHVRRIAPIQWLLAIGVVDNLMLLTLAVHVFEYLTSSVRLNWMNVDWYCKVSTYLPYAMSTLSSWLIVGISVERALVVARPFSIHTVISVHRVRVCIAVMTVVCCVVSSWTLFTVESKATPRGTLFCATISTFPADYTALITFDILASFIVPWLVVLVSNVFTLTRVCKADKTRESLMSQSRRITISVNGIETELPMAAVLRRFRMNKTPAPESVERKSAMQPPSRKRGSATSKSSACSTVTNRPSTADCPQLQAQTQQHRRVLSLLSKITFLYLILNLPHYVIRLMNLYVYEKADYERLMLSYDFQLLEKCTYLAYYSQFALNFLIYAPKYAIKSVRNSKIGQRAIQKWSRYTRKSYRRNAATGGVGIRASRAASGSAHSTDKAVKRRTPYGKGVDAGDSSLRRHNSEVHVALIEQQCPALSPSHSDDQIVRLSYKRKVDDEGDRSSGESGGGGIELADVPSVMSGDMMAIPKMSTCGGDLRPRSMRRPVEQTTIEMQELGDVESSSGRSTKTLYERKATNIQVANNLLAVTIEREWYNTSETK